MSILLILAMAGATYIGGLQNQLQPSEAEELGIEISAINLEKEFQHPYALFSFEVDLSEFSACDLRNVGVQILDDAGQVVFVSSISEEFGTYHFLLLADYLDTANLSVTCDAGPDALDPSYVIRLLEYDRPP